MRLYFLRHATAEERTGALPDAERRLTAEGVRESRGVAAGLARLGVRFDAIYTSPLARARETAEVVAAGLQGPAPVPAPALAYGCGIAELSRLLHGRRDRDHVLLVGHEPDFSAMVGALIGGGLVRMKKAAIASVDVSAVSPGAGELRWLLNPEQLALAGGTDGGG